MADWDVVSQTPASSADTAPSTGSALGGVGAQTDDFAKQTADINTKINGLIKNGALPTSGPDKDAYDALVRQRSSIAAKVKDLGDRASRAGAKAPDFGGAVDKATEAAPEPWTVVSQTPASDAPPEEPSQKEIDENVPGSPPVPGPEAGNAIIGAAKAAGGDIADLGRGLLETAKIPGYVAQGRVAPEDIPQAARQVAGTIAGGEVSPATAASAAATGARGIGDAASAAGRVAAPIVKGTGRAVTAPLRAAGDTIGRATSKAPEELATKAGTEAEKLRGAATAETESAGKTVEDTARTKAATTEADRALAQGKLDQATKALDDDVKADQKKIEALRAQRTPAAGSGSDKPYQVPQFVKGKPIEGEVPAREGAPPTQRVPGLSGELDQAIQAAQQKVQDHASRLYTMASKTAGDAPIPVAGVKDQAAKFVEALPEDVKMSVPPLIRNLSNSEAETMTLGELQQLRTTLRSLGNNPKLTPDLKTGPYRLLAKAADDALHARTNPQQVREGVRIIDAGDKFYRMHMNQFRSQTLQKIVDDTRDGLPMDASKVLSTVAQSGESGTLKRLVQIGGERARVQLRNADFDNLMATARKPGSDQIDGKKLLSAVEERQKSGALQTLYGKESSDLVSLAQKSAARDGAIDAKDLKPGSFKLALRRANQLKEEVPAKTKEAEKAASKATPEALADIKRDLEGFGVQLKDTSVGPEGVAAKADTVVDSLHRKGLIEDKKYEDYLKQVKEVKDLYAKSKKAAADRTQARKRIGKIVGGAIIAGFGYKYYREIVNIFGGAL